MDVQVYAGLRFEKLQQLLVEAFKNTIFKGLRSITVSMGINHKSENFKNKVAPQLIRLHALLKTFNAKTCFVGISITSQIPPHEKELIRNINAWASENFRQQFVAPLRDHEVCVSPTDINKIHYDIATVTKIVAAIRQFHFLWLNTPHPRSNPSRRTSN